MLVRFGTVMLRKNGENSYELTVPPTAVKHARLAARTEMAVWVDLGENAKPEDAGKLIFAKPGELVAA